MQFGYSHHYGTYIRSGDTYIIKIDSVESHKDLGILFDDCFKFHHHTTSIAANQANHILGLIKKSFESLDPDTHIISVILDLRKLENIQRRATRLVVNLQDKFYQC